MKKKKTPLIEVQDLKNYLGAEWVHQGVSLTINKGEIVGIVGGSGAGKTTLLRSMLMLHKPTSGKIKILNIDIGHCTVEEMLHIRHRSGVLFQHNALFSSLNMLENVMFPLRELTSLDHDLLQEIALLKIALTGLPLEAVDKYPAELSGGMQKRAALARAIALDPEILFLDEPTTGLDPQSASGLDELILQLRNGLNLTVVLVTHDLDTLWRITDRVAFLGEGKVLAYMNMRELIKQKHPLIQDFFAGYRGKRYSDSDP
jgi:phospholipid/cholesterol/gamma-HCH transport system ATP-binding protein